MADQQAAQDGVARDAEVPADPHIPPAYIVFIQGDPNNPRMIMALEPNYPTLQQDNGAADDEDNTRPQRRRNRVPIPHLHGIRGPGVPPRRRPQGITHQPLKAPVAPPSIREHYELINLKSSDAPSEMNPYRNTTRNELLDLLEMAGVPRERREQTLDNWALEKLRYQRRGQSNHHQRRHDHIHTEAAQRDAQMYLNTLNEAWKRQRRSPPLRVPPSLAI